MAVKGKLNDKKCFQHTGSKRPAKALVRCAGNSGGKAAVRVRCAHGHRITRRTRAVCPPAQRQGPVVRSPSKATECCHSEKCHRDVYGRQRSVWFNATLQLQGTGLNFQASRLMWGASPKPGLPLSSCRKGTQAELLPPLPHPGRSAPSRGLCPPSASAPASARGRFCHFPDPAQPHK